MPIEVLAVFSGVLSKVGAYGFLGDRAAAACRGASVHFQTLMLVIGLASILYGSAMAFTQTNARLVIGYSSVAQLGFITLGIFALAPQGAQGAVLQMVNHGIVVAPLFFIVALLAARAGGSEDIRDMGGIAMRAPVLATIFLIVTFATLAMPGSGNFVGEFLILLGLFKTKMVFSIIAFTGVVMAARLHAAHLHPHDAQPRRPARSRSRELRWRDALVLVPFVGVIVLFALYPQLELSRAQQSVTSSISAAVERGATRWPTDERVAGRPLPRLLARLHGPHIDYAAISPFEALLGGSVIVLLVGLLRSRFAREQLVPALTLRRRSARRSAVTIWQWNDHISAIAGRARGRRPDARLTIVFVAAGAAAVLLSWRARAPRESAHGEYHSLLLASIAGMAVLVAAQNLITLFIGIELLSIPLYVLCATEMHRASSLESGLKYLIIGSVGSATLVYGLALLYGATGSTDFSAIATSIAAGHGSDVLLLTGIALVARRPLLQGLGGAVSPVDARRLRGRADADHRVHGGRDQGRGVRRAAADLRRRAGRRPVRLGPGARDARDDHDLRRQRRRARRSPRSSGCSPTRRSRRPATSWAASSSRPSSAPRRRSST